ncbi:GumC family protein [Granulicella aggregans]|uniref:GumC family protein n=1 Tax=Granulicella aggregans TaxID=474949 RepID=UPI0021DFC1E8|nr:Wzz/FepE/Etk N-terminal domain-containing protein [Granulicella aggregans]
MKSEETSDFIKEQQIGAQLDEINLLDLLPRLLQHRRFILYGTLGSAILAAIFVLLIRSEYTAETVVLPPVQNSSVNAALLGQLGGSGTLASAAGASLGVKNPGDMYVSLFRSRTVEDAVIERFRLVDRYKTKRMSDARAQFESRSSVTLGAKDGLIDIQVTDYDPKMSAEIADGYVDEFRNFSANLAITEASQRRLFFQQQLRQANEDLVIAENSMQNTQHTTGVLQIDTQTRSLVESAAEVRAQIVAKEVQLQGIRAYATDNNPAVFEAKQQIAELQRQLAKLAGDSQDSSSGLLLPKGKVPEVAMEYLNKLRDVKYYETISDLVAKQLEQAKLDEARQGSVIQVVDRAAIPDKRSYPKRAQTVVVVALGSFFGTCAWCLFLEGHSSLRPRTSKEKNATPFRDSVI